MADELNFTSQELLSIFIVLRCLTPDELGDAMMRAADQVNINVNEFANHLHSALDKLSVLLPRKDGGPIQ